MKESKNSDIIFVNAVSARGALNGVINISFTAFNFTPNDHGEVEADPVVACRLRMDKVCAYQLRDAMNDLITLIEKAELTHEPGSEEPVKGVAAKRVSPEKTH